MSLDHIWASCPEYNLQPLLDACNTHLASLTPGLFVKHTDLEGYLYQWTSLLSLARLDKALLPTKHQQSLKESLPQREWAIGSLLWLIWKHRNKEIYDEEDYVFRPVYLLDELQALFEDFHHSY